MLFDNSFRIRHAESESLTARRVERLEDLLGLLVRHTDARVRNLKSQARRIYACLDAEPSAIGHRLHCVEN